MIRDIERENKHAEHLKPKTLGTIEDYPSASLNNDPMLYPGVRPEESFLLDGDNVFAVHAKAANETLDFTLEGIGGESISLDEFLISRGAAGMNDRIPILAYGANMCPASIKSKFSKVGREDAEIVPTIYGELDGYDVVWSGGPGVNGNFIANLYTGPETTDTTIAVGVNFLTEEQLLVMHGTELAYDLTMVNVVVDGKPIKALVYAGIDDILVKDGKPVAVEAIKASDRALETASTRQLLDEMLADDQVSAMLVAAGEIAEGTHADEYVAQSAELAGVPGAKLARKKVVHGVMAGLSKSRVYALPISQANLQSWANPSTIPTYGEQLRGIHHKDVYVLPNQVLEKGTWADDAKRNLVLRSMGTHLTRMTGLTEKK